MVQKLSEKAKQNKDKYIAEYKKKHYKRITLDLHNETYTKIKTICDDTNQSVNGYIKQAINDKLENESE
jgi:predicted HicB family RNase H-like nuclease